MKDIKYRLFDYRIINLSEQNVTNPVNKLSKSEKRILKRYLELGIVLFAFEPTLHVENLIILVAFQLEPSEKVKTICLDKWEKVLIPLILLRGCWQCPLY